MGSDRSTALEHSSGPAGRATFDAADLHRIAMDAHGPTDAAPTGGLDPRDGNRILAALPPDVFATLEPHIEARTLERGLKLHRPGEEILDLYFPVRCLISITVTMRDGRTAEVGVVGSQEMVGVNAFMGGRETTQTEYVVQIGGDAVRIPAGPLRAAFDGDQRVRDVFLRYTQAMIAQISQNTGCSSLHSLEQRYARWLLEC